MLAEGEVERTAGYVAELTGNIHKSADYVDANHMVVNVVLNQKYREAMEKGITMLITIGDLSKLALKEEDTVTLLVNLLDNAIEACEKQKTGNGRRAAGSIRAQSCGRAGQDKGKYGNYHEEG